MNEYLCIECGEIFQYDPFLVDPDTMGPECPKCHSDNVQSTTDEEDEI